MALGPQPTREAERERSFPWPQALLSACCGLLMALLPYVCWHHVAHSWIYIADADEIQYTLIASHAYYWHPWHLSDPTFVRGGASVYAWLQLAPAELLLKALHAEPIRLGLALRVFGGLGLGFGWYAVLWQLVRRRWAALAAAVFVLTDCGWLQTRPMLRQWTILAQVVSGRASETFAHSPGIFHDWRIISPVVVLPFLLLYLWMLRRSVERGSAGRIVASGIAFGLLFFAYFYYWTAAGLALVLGLVADRERWKVYFWTGAVGGVVGSPELARMLVSRKGQGTEWLQRFDEFVRIGRLTEHGHFLLSALLVVATYFVVRRWRRDLMYLWCLCAAGFICIHEQLLSGLQMENYHWAYLFGPCMILLLTVLVIEAVEGGSAAARWARGALVIAVALNAGAGVYLRALEAVRTEDSQRYGRGYVEFWAQHGQFAPLEAGAVAAGTDDFVQYAMIVDHATPLGAAYPVMLSPSVTDAELDHRYALNGYLRGQSREEFEAEQREWLEHLQYGVELRDLARRAERLRSRMMWFDEIARDPEREVAEYHVRYVGLPVGMDRPAALGAEWTLLQKGAAWQVWERRTRDGR